MQFYSPAEDSYFLCEVVEDYIKKLKNKTIKVFDIGTGSGIQSKNLVKLKIPLKNITASDINSYALNRVKKLKIKTKKSDLFENIKGNYDLIIFNPPYLPEVEYDKKPDTTGGKKGDEIIRRFIKDLRKHLTKRGVCFLLTSSQTPEKRWMDEAKKQKLEVKKAAAKRLFFEELYVWEIGL